MFKSLLMAALLFTGVFANDNQDPNESDDPYSYGLMCTDAKVNEITDDTKLVGTGTTFVTWSSYYYQIL